MSKAVTKGAHWLPRASQYSLHGQRNGRVDVLPANASLPTFLDLEARYELYKADLQEAQKRLEALKVDLESDREYAKHMEYFHKNKQREYIAMPSKFATKLDKIQRARERVSGIQAKLQDMRSIFFQVRDERYERIWLNTAKAMLPWDVVDQINRVVSENMRRADTSTGESGG